MVRSMLSLRGNLIRAAGPWAVGMALFLLAGGHWGAMQTMAWAGMLWNYTQADGSLVSSVKKTFDGEHPCAMCTSIKVAKEKERTVPVTVVALKKIESLPAPTCAALPPRDCREFVFPAAADVVIVARADAPPVPVPIADLA